MAESAVAAPFDLSLTISNPQVLSADQHRILEEAIVEAETLWENVILGYQPDFSLPSLPITVTANTSGLAFGRVTSASNQGGFRLSTSGLITINRSQIEAFSDYEDSGLNFIDEIMAHEIGHVLGIGTQWSANRVYAFGSGRYTGPFGVAAYRSEFAPEADFVPVEKAGGSGTANKHWDQIMRSSAAEGDPNDPWALSPLLGITDAHGRDLALELMTGAIDPDFGEPFLSRTTVQSLRDLGFRVVPEPGSGTLLLLGIAVIAAACGRRARMQSRCGGGSGPRPVRFISGIVM